MNNHEHNHMEMEHKSSSDSTDDNHSYNKHAGHSLVDFKKRFYICLALTLPVLILSAPVQQLFHFSVAFPGDRILLFLISSFVFIYGGYPFLKGAYNEIRHKAIGMMVLISLAISVAYFYSAAVVLGLSGEVFFWELVTLIDIMLLGHWIEMKSITGASQALEKLSQLIPDKAHLIKDKKIVDINTSEIKQNNVILIKPGEKIDVDKYLSGLKL